MDMDMELEAKKKALKSIIKQLQGLVAEEGETSDPEEMGMAEGMEAAEDDLMGEEENPIADLAEDLPEVMDELGSAKKDYFKRSGKINPGKSRMTVKIAAMGAPKMAMKSGKGKYS